MWILEWIPTTFVHIALVVSLVALIVASFIDVFPILNTYSKPIQIIAVLILVVCFWLEGGISEQNIYKEKIAQADLKIQELQTASAKVTIQTVIKYQDVEKKVFIKGKSIETEIIKYIDRIDSTGCIIPNEAIKVTDEAADKDWIPK